jgi:hypothetical protein
VQYGLYLLGHFDLPTRPDRCERALRVFFPQDAAGYGQQMSAGTPLLVRTGERVDMSDFGSNLRAQGFRTEIRELVAVAA